MKVELIKIKRDDHGFESYRVLVNGVMVHTHMGEREARCSFLRLCNKLGVRVAGK